MRRTALAVALLALATCKSGRKPAVTPCSEYASFEHRCSRFPELEANLLESCNELVVIQESELDPGEADLRDQIRALRRQVSCAAPATDCDSYNACVAAADRAPSN